MKTIMQKKEAVVRSWHLVDLKDKVLGRTASQISQLLMGKNKPTYTPHVDVGDYVVVINAKKVKVTGGKEDKKIYQHHTMFPGGLRQYTLSQLATKDSRQVIFLAVKGMLPKNKLRAKRLERLKIYPAADHPYAQKFIGDKHGGK